MRTILILLLALGRLWAQAPDFLADNPGLIMHSEQDWGVLGQNVAAHQDGSEGQPLRIGEISYSRGLGHHANGNITVWLDGRYSAFEAEIGVQPCSGGSVVFRIHADGELRFDSGVLRSGDPPHKVQVALDQAQELRLEAWDAGDGISCDMANWAEARLIPALHPANRGAEAARVDIARFARTVAWDPVRKDGAHASRIEEFRAEDLFPESQLRPNRDGSFTVPVNPSGTGCIGLQWLNRRYLRELGLTFTSPGPTSLTAPTVVEGWFGESVWQGKWEKLDGEFHTQGQRVMFRTGTKRPVQTWKIRWILPALPRDARVRLSATSCANWSDTNLLLQIEDQAGKGHGSVRIVNGEATNDIEGKNGAIRWDLSRVLRQPVRFSRPSSLNSDPTSLQIQLPAGQVAVSVADVLSNECVYLPDFGLFVTRDPSPSTLPEYKRRIAGRTTILEQVRNLPDQTVQQAMARTHHEFQNEGPVLLSLACDNTKFVVERAGGVHFHPGPFEWLAMSRQVDWQPWFKGGWELRPRFGIGPTERITRALEGGWLPMPVTTVIKDGIRYSQRTYVAPLGPHGSAGPFAAHKSVCVVEFLAVNTQAAPAKATLGLSFASPSPTDSSATLESKAQRVLVSTSGRPIAAIDFSDGRATNLTFSPGGLLWEPSLDPGGKAGFSVYLPGEGVRPEEISKLSGAPRLREETKEYWESLLGGAMQVETPEELLNNVIRSSQVRCLIDARSEADGKRVGASIAAMSYGPLESEAHSVIRGMDFMGHDEFARRSLEFFIYRYNTNGFLTTGYTTFGTAWHLWTVGQHYQLARDTNWLRQAAPELVRVCHWVERQLDKTKKLDAFGRPVPESGLMPPGVLADWNSFAFHFAMNAYYAAGLREVGRALEDIRNPEARHIARVAEQLREHTLRAYQWTQARSPAVSLRDGTWIPYYPSQVHSPGRLADFFPGQDAGRSWCYDVELGAHQLGSAGVINPSSREARRMMDHMEDVQFLADGWFDYPARQNLADWFNLGGFSKVQPYYTRNCEVYALQDEVKPFVRSYCNSIAALLNPEVLTFWEHFHHSGAWDKTHETGYFLYQTRTMLVQERGRELWLVPFITDQWLKDGAKLSVTNAPTRFGPVTFRIASHVAQGYIEARVEPPNREPPKAVCLRLRHPEGKPIRAVTLNGRRVQSFEPTRGTVTFKPGRPVTVRAEF